MELTGLVYEAGMGVKRTPRFLCELREWLEGYAINQDDAEVRERGWFWEITLTGHPRLWEI